MWEQDVITFSQRNKLQEYACKSMAKKFVPDVDKLWRQLGKFTKGQAHEAITLFKSHRGGQALLKLKEFGCDVTITKEDIKSWSYDLEHEQKEQKKEENIRWLNALNNATLLVVHGKTDKKLEDAAEYIYNLKAPNSK